MCLIGHQTGEASNYGHIELTAYGYGYRPHETPVSYLDVVRDRRLVIRLGKEVLLRLRTMSMSSTQTDLLLRIGDVVSRA